VLAGIAETPQTAGGDVDRSLAALVDTARYPLDEPGATGLTAVVERAQADLERFGCARLDGFIRCDRRAMLTAETERLARLAEPKETRFTPYIQVDESFPEDHPRRRVLTSTNGFVTRDLIPADTLIQHLYRSGPFMRFLAACFGKPTLHPFADPMRGLVVNVMPDGATLNWHFDGNAFIVSLMTKPADAGGVFEYCPDIRRPGAENYEAVRDVLDGGRTRVRALALAVGDLQLFKGRYALHRVTPARGERHCVLFGYSETPGFIGSAESTIKAYGRAMPEHYAADSRRLDDGLAD
jgi:hypothetical protein